MPTAPVSLKSKRLLIRHAQPFDIPAILSYYKNNQEHLAPFEPLKPSVFYTKKYWENEIYQRLIDTQEEKAIKLFIFLRKSRSPLIGTLNFSNLTRGVFQNCTVGYSLGKQYQGKGYMNEALKVGLRYMFTDLKFHRVGANYMPQNQRSGRLLKRLGFTVNGYAPDYLYIAGQWQDHILTSFVNTTVQTRHQPDRQDREPDRQLDRQDREPECQLDREPERQLDHEPDPPQPSSLPVEGQEAAQVNQQVDTAVETP